MRDKFTRNNDRITVFDDFLMLPKIDERRKAFCLKEKGDHASEFCDHPSYFYPSFEADHTVAVTGDIEHHRDRSLKRGLNVF